MPPPDTTVVRVPPGDTALLRRALARFGADPGTAPDAFAAAPGALAVVATTAEDLAGWCWGHLLPRPDGGRMAYLHHLEVAEPHRRRGIGRALTEAFLEAAAHDGATRAFLTTGRANTAARRLYESLGATPAAQGPTVNYWWSAIPCASGPAAPALPPPRR